MASIALRQFYRNARSAGTTQCVVGESALSAWRAARILRKWDALETIGAVRVRAEFDQDCDPTEFGGSADDEAFGSIGEYRTDFATPDWYPGDIDSVLPAWNTADSVWGHVGYRNVLDWRENAYILDIMASTIDAFRDSWKAHVRAERERKAGLCPACHGTGKAN